MGSLQQQYALVTGVAVGGIGFYVALGLAKANYHVTIGGRTEKKVQTAISSLVNDHGVSKDQFTFLQYDGNSLKSTKQLAEQYIQSGKPLHVLVNNAGCYSAPPSEETGLAGVYTINFLSPLLLCELLAPLIAKSKGRIVNVASTMHRSGSGDYETASKKDAKNAYGTSKLALIHASRVLHRKYKSHGVAVFSIHPGAVVSNFYTAMLGETGDRIFRTLAGAWFISPEDGAQPIISAALEQPTTTTESLYLNPYKQFSLLGPVGSELLGSRFAQQVSVGKPSTLALDDQLAEKQVTYAEKLLRQHIGEFKTL